jgi:hypothetical protein
MPELAAALERLRVENRAWLAELDDLDAGSC